MKIWVGALILVCGAVSLAYGKRVPAPVVSPIRHEGVVYHAGGNGEDAFVLAKDEKTGKELWKAKLYHVQIDPLKEADVQMIFIKDMLLSGEKLLIQDEAGRCYGLQLATHRVQGESCKKYRSLRTGK